LRKIAAGFSSATFATSACRTEIWRFTAPTETDATNPAVRQALVAKVAEEKPAAIFLNGDLPCMASRPITTEFAPKNSSMAQAAPAGLSGARQP